MTSIPMRIAGIVVSQKNATDEPPTRPSFRGFPIFATPTNTVTPTRGITTIWIARMNAVPRGSDASAIAISVVLPVSDATTPSASPSPSPARIASWLTTRPPRHAGPAAASTHRWSAPGRRRRG